MATLRRGHAPGYLRDAFLDALEAKDLPTAQRLAGSLWNCTDCIPGRDFDELDLPRYKHRQTHAAVARIMKASWRWGDWDWGD